MRATFSILTLLLTWFPFPALSDDSCKAAENTGSYRAIAECGHQEFLREERELNKTYKELLLVLKDDSEKKKLLIDSQRGWLRYRNSSCQLNIPYNVSWCMSSVTTRRTTELKEFFSCFTEGGASCQ